MGMRIYPATKYQVSYDGPGGGFLNWRAETLIKLLDEYSVSYDISDAENDYSDIEIPRQDPQALIDQLQEEYKEEGDIFDSQLPNSEEPPMEWPQDDTIGRTELIEWAKDALRYGDPNNNFIHFTWF